MQGFDLSTISDCYIGNNQVSEIWLGQTKIWPTTSPYADEYFTIESLQNNQGIYFTHNYDGSGSYTPLSIQWSYDKTTWYTATASYTSTAFVTLNTNDKIYIKGNNNTYNFEVNDPYLGPQTCVHSFSYGTGLNISGNIMSLIYGDNFRNIDTFPANTEYNFFSLFDNFGVIDASNLILPATILTPYCYRGMFWQCDVLETAPELPATTLTEGCYYEMFLDCSSLVTAPELPATTLASGCYFGMFEGCTSLVNAPNLPATTLADSCYQFMFYGCDSLTTTPIISATTLADNCYSSMFEWCISLTTAPSLPITTLAPYCYDNMFANCTSLTTAPTLPATTLTPYCYSSMFEGCTSLTTAPELLADFLESHCYAQMFKDCTSLNYIKCLATGTNLGYYSTLDWVDNVASSGTFIKDANEQLWITGSNGIPSGWTVQNA